MQFNKSGLEIIILSLQHLLDNEILQFNSKKIPDSYKALSPLQVFKISTLPLSKKSVLQNIKMLRAGCEVIQQKLCKSQKLCDSFLLKQQKNFIQLCYTMLRMDYNHQSIRTILYFVYHLWNYRKMPEIIFQFLLISAYNIYLPIKQIEFQKYYQALTKNSYKPLLFNVNCANHLAISLFQASYQTKVPMNLCQLQTDPDIIPLRHQLAKQKITISTKDQSMHIQFAIWLGLNKRFPTVIQPTLKCNFPKINFNIKVTTRGFLSEQIQEFQMFMSAKNFRFDLKKYDNDSGKEIKCSYFYKDDCLLFYDHEKKIVQIVQPQFMQAQVIPKSLKLKKTQKKMGQKTYLALQFIAIINSYTVREDYLQKIQKLPSEKKKLMSSFILDAPQLMSKRPVAYLKQYQVHEQILSKTKYKLSSKSYDFDIIFVKDSGLGLGLQNLLKVLKLLSIQYSFLTNFSQIIKKLIQTYENTEHSLLDFRNCLPFKMLLRMSLVKSIELQITKIRTTFNQKQIFTLQGYQRKRLGGQSLSRKSSIFPLTQSEIMQWSVQNQKSQESGVLPLECQIKKIK